MIVLAVFEVTTAVLMDIKIFWYKMYLGVMAQHNGILKYLRYFWLVLSTHITSVHASSRKVSTYTFTEARTVSIILVISLAVRSW